MKRTARTGTNTSATPARVVKMELQRLVSSAALRGREHSAARSVLLGLIYGPGMVADGGRLTFTHEELALCGGVSTKTVQRGLRDLVALGIISFYLAGYAVRGDRRPSRARVGLWAVRALIHVGRAAKDALLAAARVAAAARVGNRTLISRSGRPKTPSQRVSDTRTTPSPKGARITGPNLFNPDPPPDLAAAIARCRAEIRPTKRPGVGVGG
jgi:hypothetical protein